MDGLITTAAPAIVNDQFAGQLVTTGHVYLAAGFVLLQLILLPLTGLVWKHYQNKAKEAADTKEKNAELKAQGEAQKVDSRFEKLEGRIESVEKDYKHEIEDIKETVNSIKKTMDRIFSRMDDMSEKVNEIWLTNKIKKEMGAKDS